MGSWEQPEFWAGCVCLGSDTAKRAGPLLTASRDQGQELGSLHSLSGCRGWRGVGAVGLGCPPHSYFLSCSIRSPVLLKAVSPGPSQGLAESGCLTNMCWPQECLQTLTLHFTVYRTPSHLLSHLIFPTALRGRSFSPILQMRKLWLRDRGSDFPRSHSSNPLRAPN